VGFEFRFYMQAGYCFTPISNPPTHRLIIISIRYTSIVYYVVK